MNLLRQYLERLRAWLTLMRVLIFNPDIDRQLIQLYHKIADLNLNGKYTQAVETAKQCCELAREFGEDHPIFAISLNNLAVQYSNLSNYLEAETLHHQALEILRVRFGTSHREFANSLHNLSVTYLGMGDYRRAEPLCRQVLEVARTSLGAIHPDTARYLSNLGVLYFEMGEYDRSEPLLREALVIQRTILGEDHPGYATSLKDLALMYSSTGNYKQAELLLEQSFKITRSVFGETHPTFAEYLLHQVGLYMDMELFDKAETLIHQALEILHAALDENHPTIIAHSLQMFLRQGRFGKAEELMLQLLEFQHNIFGENHPQIFTSLNNLALLYHSTGHYEQAEALYKQAIENSRACMGEDHSDTQLHYNLARLYVVLGKPMEAIPFHRNAIAVDDKTIGKVFAIGSESWRSDVVDLVRLGLELHMSLVSQYLAESPNSIQEALNLVLRRKGIEFECLAIQRDTVIGGRYPALQEPLRRLSTLRAQIGRETLNGLRLKEEPLNNPMLVEWNEQKISLEAELARRIPEMNIEKKLLEAHSRQVAGCLPAGSALVEFVHFNMFDFTINPNAESLCWKQPHYVAFVMLAGEPEKVRMINLGEASAIDGLIQDFRNNITGDKDIRITSTYPDPLTATIDMGRRGQHTNDETFLPDWAREGFANAKQTTGETTTSSPQDDPALGAKKDSFTSNIGVTLREALFDPLLPTLNDCKCLLIAPDGDLNRLPFEVLPDVNGGYLIDRYQISYIVVGRDLLRFGAESSRQPSNPVVIADPDFDLCCKKPHNQPTNDAQRDRQSRDLGLRNNFSQLPGTRAEGEQIAAMLDVQPWLGSKALKKPLKALLSPQILHFATHGFFLDNQKLGPNVSCSDLGITAHARDSLGSIAAGEVKNPLLRSGLALAGANTWLKGNCPPDNAEDGLLTAEDVTGLDLMDTELVVLSACDTGLGEVKIGEGVFGLRRAFELAGAKTLIMSLWKVPDQQTKELMRDFYSRILAGQARAEALRQAQLSIKAKHPDPLYWGAFICQGDPAPLRNANSTKQDTRVLSS